jgi:hypothetical protein
MTLPLSKTEELPTREGRSKQLDPAVTVDLKQDPEPVATSTEMGSAASTARSRIIPKKNTGKEFGKTNCAKTDKD